MYLQQLEIPTAFKLMSLQTIGHIIPCNTNQHSQDFYTSIPVIADSINFLAFQTGGLPEAYPFASDKQGFCRLGIRMYFYSGRKLVYYGGFNEIRYTDKRILRKSCVVTTNDHSLDHI